MVILELLQADATQPIGDIAEQVGISKSACWRRIKKLEDDGVITDKVTLLDQTKVGLSLTAYIAVKTNQHNDEWAAKFKAVLMDIPSVLEVHRTSGDCDYVIKAAVENMPGYDRLYKQLIKADIFDVNCSFVMETIKYTTKLPLDNIREK
jgi:Lrp/AsnC family transcriptional regulator